MTQEDKELLLKDLCARLPYGVKCYGYCFKIDGNHCECYGTLDSIKLGVWYPFHLSDRMSINNGATYEETFSEVKPYLFPLSSITEEQSMELFKLFGINLVDSIGTDYIKINECTGITFFLNKGFDVETHLDKLIDWLNKNHFDYRGLIPKGIALDATGLNIYENND